MWYAAGSMSAPRHQALGFWGGEIAVRPACALTGAHVLHAYFNACPESPDGRHVLAFVSDQTTAEVGHLVVIERISGAVRELTGELIVEDAHRQAYQQWVCGGEQVVYQDLRAGQWIVAARELSSGQERVLCSGRQLGWAQPHACLVPLHGPHWAPGTHRDLQLLDVTTGEVRTALRAEDVVAEHADWVRHHLGDGPISIFFPVLSPDLGRVFFKLATPLDGVFRSPRASRREGLFVYDLRTGRCLLRRDTWGHPAWFPDSRRIINIPPVVIDLDSATEAVPSGLPSLPGRHPSVARDGRTLVADALVDAEDRATQRWSIVVADLAGGGWRLLWRAPGCGPGTSSWRPPHPHPVFSADGRRIYFNLNTGANTLLHVAAVRTGGPG